MDFRITMTGVTGLIMNNARLANPLNPTVKAIKTLTGKASKDRTDEDREEIMRLEHAGALYHDADIGPYLPGDNIWRSLQEGAVKHRLGPKFEQGVLIVTDTNPVSYRGPRDVDDLWADENFRFYASRVTGSGRRRVRNPFCRPIFRQWKTEARGTLDPSILDFDQLVMAAESAGTRVGIGDWRPRFGKYSVTVEKI